MLDDPRPEWPYKLNLTDFRLLISSKIIKITYETDKDSREFGPTWIVLFHSERNTFKAPTYWDECFSFSPEYGSLITLNYAGEHAAKSEREIAVWEKRQKRDLSEFKRLKKKFGF